MAASTRMNDYATLTRLLESCSFRDTVELLAGQASISDPGGLDRRRREPALEPLPRDQAPPSGGDRPPPPDNRRPSRWRSPALPLIHPHLADHPLRKASTITTKMAPWITSTNSPIAAR